MANWERLIDYPDYMASDEGDIKRIEVDGSLSDVPKRFDDFGYQVVDLIRPNGIICEEAIDRLIGELFTPTYIYDDVIPDGAWDRLNETAIAHIDGDLTNNRIENLKWVNVLLDPDESIRKEYISKIKQNEPEKHKRGKKGNAVICENIETGERIRFETQDAAEVYLGVKNISPVLSGKQKTAAGYRIWKEYNP